MSVADLRAVSFAAPDGSLWGAAFEHGPGALVVGGATAGEGVVGLTFTQTGEGWRLQADGVALDVTPLAAPDPADGEPPAPGRRAVPGVGPELCRVHGMLTIGGEPVNCDVTGIRVALAPPSSSKDAYGSARLVGAWLTDGAAVGLLSARSARASDQAGDRVVASLLDPGAWTEVDDPRLSTTYGADGSPTRCNLELWVSDGEDEFPRRTAGEASGPAVGAVTGERLTLQVAPLHVHSRGEDGAGVYALASLR